jgi:hypothetical protein
MMHATGCGIFVALAVAQFILRRAHCRGGARKAAEMSHLEDKPPPARAICGGCLVTACRKLPKQAAAQRVLSNSVTRAFHSSHCPSDSPCA